MEVCFFLMRNSLFLKEFTADISYLHANAILLCIYVKLFPCHNSTGIQPILVQGPFPASALTVASFYQEIKLHVYTINDVTIHGEKWYLTRLVTRKYDLESFF